MLVTVAGSYRWQSTGSLHIHVEIKQILSQGCEFFNITLRCRTVLYLCESYEYTFHSIKGRKCTTQ